MPNGSDDSKPSQPKRAPSNYRERWYAERHLDYQPPKLGDVGMWKSVGRLAHAREPGED